MRLALVLLVGFVACIVADNRWERLRESKEYGDYRHVSNEHRSHEYREQNNRRRHSDEHRDKYKPEERSNEYKPEEPRRHESYKPEHKSKSHEEYKPEPHREEYKPEHKNKSHEAYKKSSEEHKKSKSHEHENKSYEKRPSYPSKNPFPIYIGKLIDVQKAGVRGDVYFVNSTTILLKKFSLPPGPPAPVFWLDKYNTLSGLGIHLKSDKYGYNLLGCYEDDDVFVTIPKSKEDPTLLSYHSFGIYCVLTQVNYGYIHW